jgi:hypothetical protein
MQGLKDALKLNEASAKQVQKELDTGGVFLDGDFPEIWNDRPWHPLTKTEIYLLIWATKKLGFELPRLTLERIGFWIQLIELAKDFRAGTLVLQLVDMYSYPWPTLHSLWANLNYVDKSTRANERIRVQKTDYDNCDSWRWLPHRIQWISQHGISKVNPDHAYKLSRTLAQFLKRKDRYRIVISNREQLDIKVLQWEVMSGY